MDLLKNSAASPAGRPQGGGAPNAGGGKPFSFSFESIRESIRKIDPQQERQRQPPLRFLNNTPDNIFGREMRQRAGKPQPGEGKEDEDAGVFLANEYTPEQLGQMLRELRPADAGKDGKEWFSLQELQGRIAKIAEKERGQADPRDGGGYFHPDHMSGEEKMKLELQKVRDEFKMSENDCGSARVQIAQLTLKIKHLSSVLHKKDKHSRKGLQDMVQRRKKYLKYLRRTDWDSYCLVLSKLGLRDTPEYKAADYKKTQPTKAQSKKSKSKRKRKMKA
ncbi:30S ribosomal protein S15 [Triticum urartu]|uniref:Small ribosomal subunit protein uS15c n=1 Tax=Triticum urartu TaxID=4572 RepID=M7YFP9_TRIUA|nr:30S ribosomal protein S15 [Triticum urartu]